MRTFLPDIELYLTAAGVLVTLLLPSIGGWQGGAWWQATAITACAVGLVHGLLFWVIRRRQREVRAAIIAELRAMLKDRVNNQLMALVGEVSLQASSFDDPLVGAVHGHAQRITTLLNGLSEESLRSWQHAYTAASVSQESPSR